MFPWSAIIGGASNLIGGWVQNRQQNRMNDKQEAFSREMYQRQQADNVAFWHQQNEYNSPEQQIKRLREAGINPAIMYGGNASGAAGQAGPIENARPGQVDYKAAPVGDYIARAGESLMNSMYDIEIKKAQADNMKAQNSVLLQEAVLKAAQTEETLARGQRGWFDLQFERDLREVSADARKEAVRQMRVNMDVTQERNAREAVQNAASVQEAFARMAKMEEEKLSMQQDRRRSAQEIARSRAEVNRINQDILNMQRDGTLKDIDISLREKGINPNDPTWMRLIARAIEGFATGEIKSSDLKSYILGIFGY
nr:MAG: DNA pilot protein [Microvirus sp.]